MRAMGRQVLGHILGLVVFFLVGVVVGIAYIVIVGNILGRGGDGFGLVAALFSFPLFGTMCGVAWIAVWLVHHRFAGPMSQQRSLAASAVLALLVALVIAGPRGFTMAGGSTLFNYFLIALVVAAARAHRALIARASRKAS
jgi:hypothetical protein